MGLKIFEGPRNSGKTFLSIKYSEIKEIPLYKFDFVGWFNRLLLDDKSRETHSFALGKELMLLQLNSQNILPDIIVDRGIVTVLTWGVLSGRIESSEAHKQLRMIGEIGLFNGCEFYYISGKNPDTSPRKKDNWDFRDFESKESEIMESMFSLVSSGNYGSIIHRIENTFDEKVIETLKLI